MKKTGAWLGLALMLASCGETAGTARKNQKGDLACVDKLCATHPLVGQTKGIKAELDAQRDKLKSAKAGITLEKYDKLSQELKNYTADWETLNGATQLSCKSWALCECREKENCKDDLQVMEFRQDAAREFLIKVKELEQNIDASSKAPSISHAVPMTLGSKLSGKEFSMDITVRNPTSKTVQLDQVKLDFSGPRASLLASVTEVSGTYAVMIDPDTGKALVHVPGSQEQYDAYAWFPSGCNDQFMVKFPLWQTIKPNEVDRFIIKVTFPDNACMQQATFTDVKVNILYNGFEWIDSGKLSLSGG